MYPLRQNQDSAPRLHYCFLAVPPLSLHPLPSLISNSLNLPFGTQGRSWRLESFHYKQEMGDMERLSCPGVPQCPAWFQHWVGDSAAEGVILRIFSEGTERLKGYCPIILAIKEFLPASTESLLPRPCFSSRGLRSLSWVQLLVNKSQSQYSKSNLCSFFQEIHFKMIWW